MRIICHWLLLFLHICTRFGWTGAFSKLIGKSRFDIAGWYQIRTAVFAGKPVPTVSGSLAEAGMMRSEVS
jgi:hypothetical protein